jgi:hypothetical protein
MVDPSASQNPLAPQYTPSPPHAHPAPQPPYPQPPEPTTAAGHSPWPLVAAASGAIALVAVAIVVLVLSNQGAGSGVSAATVPTLTTPGTPSPGARQATGSAASLPTSSNQARSSSAAGHSSPSFVAYTGVSISARIPSGWATVEDEAHKPGYVESKWRDPTSPGDTILIDTSPSTPDTLEQDAAPVHAALTKESGYREIFYGPGDLTGVQSWKWVFRVEGDQRVDYFFNHCASGYAVLGSAPPSHFARLEATFNAVTRSVRPTAEPQC